METSNERLAAFSARQRALLLARLRAQRKESQDPAGCERVERTPAATFALSFAQQRLWFLSQLDPHSPAYIICGALQVSGALNVPALRLSLHQVVQRHESLRTIFLSVEGQGRQALLAASPLSLPLLDLQGLPSHARAEVVRVCAEEEQAQPFQLARGPLLRCTLIRMERYEHLLLLSMHHIISDGWSMEIFLRELVHLYACSVRGEEPQLPVLPIQYIDFASWQRQWVSGERRAQLEAYWRERLRGVVPLEFPPDYPHPQTPTSAGAAIPFQLGAHLAAGLQALGRQEGATLFMTLLGAFLVALYRSTGQEDLVVGTPSAQRPRAEVENLIGFFVNTLALRVRLTGTLSFREVLARVREVTLAACSHQDLPFEQVVDLAHAVRDGRRAPLCQVMCVLQNAPQWSLALPGVTVQPWPLPTRVVRFDLTLELTETPQGIAGSLQYRTDLFEAATIQRLAAQYQRLLAELAAAPHLPIGQISLLSQAQREQMTHGWNATARAYPAEDCLHELFAAQACQAPEAVALVYGEQHLSYGELDARANRLAHYLRSRGVGPDVAVGLCLERSCELVVGMLGILKAGGACVPLDPDVPAARLAARLAGACLVLTQSHLHSTFAPHALPTLCLDTAARTLAAYPASAPRPVTVPQHLAYIMHTSGSTGAPKGIMIPHRALVNHMHWMQEAFPLTTAARVLQKTPCSFDASLWECYAPLLAGACLVLAEPGGHRESAYLIRTIGREQISILQVVPTLLRALVQEPALAECRSLARLFCGGEELPGDLLARALALLPATTRVCNLYGPTECAIDASCWESPGEHRAPHVPIGRPIANVQLYVLDQRMQPVPVGVSGELYIGGAGVARGYAGQAELTAERFVPDPFGGQMGGRLYRTGDLARYLPTGDLVALGRSDQQVKIRGMRIEPGEIEAALGQHPAVAACAVLAQEDEQGDRRLVAYLALHTQTAPTCADLRRALLQQLPAYMLPSRFAVLPAFPLTPGGKVDRRALRTSAQAHFLQEDPSCGPRTPTEEVLAAIWARVLQVERVGVHDNFFALGGHSLLATQVLYRIQQTFQREVSLRQLFAAPTVADLAHCLASAQQESARPMAPRPASARGRAPLSFAQQRLWFLDQLIPGNPFYIVPFVLRLQGHLAVEALRESFQSVAQRHEILRTTFGMQDGQPVQCIAPGLALWLPLLDLCALPPATREHQVQVLVQQEATRPFDLATGPLVRLSLLRLAPEEHLLLLSLHHIVCDAWSLGVLFEEVSSLYTAWPSGASPSPGHLPIQYADYASWQREVLQGERLSALLAYWRQHLAGAPAVLELPTDHPRPSVQTYRGALYTFTLPAALTRDLNALSRQQEVTLFMTLLAAFGCLLARYSHQQDLVIGTPIANRTHAETEELIGFFTNTLALRLTLSPRTPFVALLAEVRELALAAYAHQDLPFEQLVEATQPARTLSHAPLFQVLFTLQHLPGPTLQLPGLQVTLCESAWRSAKFDLSLLMYEGTESLQGVFEYNTDLFEPATIERLAGHWQTLLSGIVAGPQQALACLPLLDDRERQLLLKTWNATQAAYPRARSVHQLFEEQVERAPEAIAVVCGAEQLSYGALNRRANQLARYLRSLGVGPETCVGVCLERRPDLVIALLGILKAGGAYVPLDQASPPERLALMLAGARVELVVMGRRLAASFPQQSQSLRLLVLDEVEAVLDAQGQENPRVAVHPDTLCYVVYTSGSTGVPRGVCLPHRSLVNLVRWQLACSQALPLTRTLQFSSLLFDPLFQELFSTFAAGGALLLISEATRRDPEALLTCMEAGGIERIYLPFVALQHLAEFAMAAGKTLPCLREILTAGEQLQMTPELRAWLQRMPRCTLQNYYGPAETHVVTSFQADPWQPVALPPIGRPIANTQAYVLDGALQPVPIGVAGELYIGGESVGRGYAGRPHLTAERFLPDPSGDRAGAVLYRTGDRVRYLADGALEFLGRVDVQIKIRGYRVEPGEIEYVLQQHPRVQACAVVAQGEGRDRRLIAWVVATEPETGLGATLLAYARTKLPEYMLPVAVLLREVLPVTATGKVDRRALSAAVPGLLEVEREGVFVAPRTPLEQQVQEIWSELLHLSAIGIHDNFFAIGGQSLLATRLMVCIRERIQPDFALRTVFEAPTIASLAEAIVEHELASADAALLQQLCEQLEEQQGLTEAVM